MEPESFELEPSSEIFLQFETYLSLSTNFYLWRAEYEKFILENKIIF